MEALACFHSIPISDSYVGLVALIIFFFFSLTFSQRPKKALCCSKLRSKILIERGKELFFGIILFVFERNEFIIAPICYFRNVSSNVSLLYINFQ